MKGKASKRLFLNRFTLIELLIVVAVIMILVSLLLPALGKVKAVSKRISCANGMRQAGMGVLSYSESYDGFLPQSSSPHSGAGVYDYSYWYTAAAAELGCPLPSSDAEYVSMAPTPGVFWCPAIPETALALMRKYNWLSCNGGFYYMGIVANYNTLPHFNDNPPYLKLVKIKRPSQLDMLADGNTYLECGDAGPAFTWAFEKGNAKNRLSTLRHQRGCNLTFSDGHVSWAQITKSLDFDFMMVNN
jgi:prepilin-type processing-associated H-X9-DG protein